MEKIESCVLIPEETDFLVEYASKSKHSLIELGSQYGRSSVVLGQVAREKGVLLFCVDTWEDKNIYESWKENIIRKGLRKVVIPVISTTNTAWRLLNGIPYKYDFLFIDADHEYESVKADYENYSQFLEHPAHVVFHDLNMGKVRRYFDELDDIQITNNNIGAVYLS